MNGKMMSYNKQASPPFLKLSPKSPLSQEELEKQILQFKQMNAVESLASGVAHHFNNYFAIIRGYTEIIHQTLNDDDMKKFSSQILETVDKASLLINELKTSSSNEMGDGEDVDVNHLVTAFCI